MKKTLGIIMLCVLALLSAVICAQAENISVQVQWMDTNGAHTAQAQLMPGRDDHSYWLELPADADWNNLTALIIDAEGRYTFEGNWQVIPNVVDAGNDPDSVWPIEFMGYDNGQPGYLLYLYISSCPMPGTSQTVSAPVPTEQPPVQPVNVTVHYRDAETGYAVANDTFVLCVEGTNAVYPVPNDLKANYQLTGESTVYVNVGLTGADRNEVVFYYRYVKPPVNPVTVRVRYMDAATGEAVASDTFFECREGMTPVYPVPNDLKANYQLTGDSAVYVTVNESGADRNEVVFFYNYVRPYVNPVTVRVHYTDEATGAPIASDTECVCGEGTTTVRPNPYDLRENYDLTGNAAYEITVNENGADRYEVTFTYVYSAPSVRVVLHYRDAATGESVAQDSEYYIDQSQTLWADPVGLRENYTPSGAGYVNVTVSASGASPSEYTFLYTYVTPEAEARTVPVYYLDSNGTQIAPCTYLNCEAGTTTIWPASNMIPEGYSLLGNGYETVTVDRNGASPDAVCFYYAYQKPAATVAPAQVIIRYVDENGNSLQADQIITFQEGGYPIHAPEMIGEDYTLSSQNDIQVTVDATGAHPAVVSFVYKAPEHTPQVALVTVKYADRDIGRAFYNYNETCFDSVTNTINVSFGIAASYGYDPGMLISPESVNVYVDENGAANPGEITFWFSKSLLATPEPTQTPYVITGPVNIPVYYVDSYGHQIATSREWPCSVGNNRIAAEPTDLPSGYVLMGEPYQYVTLSMDGALSQSNVIFYYSYTATPAPTVFPYDYEPFEAYGYPTGDSINFRKEPSRESARIKTVNRSNLAYIYGRVTDANKDVWYAVEIGGDRGYLRKDVIRILTEKEIAALFGYTPAPTAVPTPAPTPIPDGTAIDLWGVTTSKVNFRQDKSRGAKVISELKKGTTVWVYSSETVGSDKWYRICANGKYGYLMADYVALYSAEESEKLQRTFASPMPTASPSPVPTMVPTATPWWIPTAVPTEVPTPTPVPKSGYAQVLWQTALKYGEGDDATVKEWLGAGSLVYITYQHANNGEIWDYVQYMNTGSQGYVQDRALACVSNEEAAYYLSLLEKSKTTPTPVPQQQSGYACVTSYSYLGVPMRSAPDTNAEIVDSLTQGTVVYVDSQFYSSNETWHVVYYDNHWGYVRYDQLTMLSEEETAAYIAQLEKTLWATATPAPTPTINPQEALTCYGYVSTAKVNLRKLPSTGSTSYGLLNQYTFAYIMDEPTVNSEGTWYHVQQNGTEGYINGRYFKQLTNSELYDFLKSPEYSEANQTARENGTSTNIQSVEDYNRNVWTNPAITTSYEPFTPVMTATPVPYYTQAPTFTPLPTAAPTARPTVAPIGGFATAVPANTEQKGSNTVGIVLLGASAAAIGGGYYAFATYRRNERRRKMIRARQAQQAQQAQRTAQYGRPEVQQRYSAQQNYPQQGYRPNGTQNYPPNYAPNYTQNYPQNYAQNNYPQGYQTANVNQSGGTRNGGYTAPYSGGTQPYSVPDATTRVPQPAETIRVEGYNVPPQDNGDAAPGPRRRRNDRQDDA